MDAASGEGEQRAQEGEGQDGIEVEGPVAEVEGRALGAVQRAVTTAHHVVPQEVPQRHLTIKP